MAGGEGSVEEVGLVHDEVVPRDQQPDGVDGEPGHVPVALLDDAEHERDGRSEGADDDEHPSTDERQPVVLEVVVLARQQGTHPRERDAGDDAEPRDQREGVDGVEHECSLQSIDRRYVIAPLGLCLLYLINLNLSSAEVL